MHEPGDKAILTDNGLAVAPGLHTLFDIGHTVVSTKNSLWLWVFLHRFIKDRTRIYWHYSGLQL